MKPAMLTTRAAAATVALGLGVALANAAAPTAAADATGSHQSSAGSTPNKVPTSKTRTGQPKSTGSTKRAKTGVQATSVVRSVATARPGTGTLRPRPAPLTGNSESPANWLLAAAARRELGDHPLEELGRRIGLAVNTVLAPANTLVRNLVGIADPLAPGQCKDGVCNPTSDFSLPFVRTEVTVLNLTGGPITLTSLDTKQPLTYGPQEGFVLDDARLVQVGFYQGTSEWDKDWTYEGTMVWSNGSTTVSVDAEAGGASASVSNSDLQTLIFDTPEPINGISEIPARQTVVVLPKAGAEITIDPTDAVGQAVVAMALCKVAGSCGQEVVDEQVLLSAPQLVGNTLFNDGSVDSTTRYKVTHEVTKTSGVEENLKVVAGSSLNFSLGPLTFQSEIGALVQQKYGHSWSDGVTTESQVDLNVPPGSYGQIYVQYPEYHDFVNMTLTESGVTITIPNVEYVSLAPSGSLDPDGTPLAVTYTTDDWKIGTGPHPYPDSDSVPAPPDSTAVDAGTVPDIAAPAPAPTATRKTLVEIIDDFVSSEARALRTVPTIMLTGRAISSQTFRVVNLTPYPQTLSSITGEYEEDDSPQKGFVLQPFQEIDFEVDYSVWHDQEAYVTWTNETGIDASAEFKVFNGGSAPLVTCQSSSGCMAYGYGKDEAWMYLVYPYANPGTIDVTEDPNLASAAVDTGCSPAYSGSVPGSCGVNVTGDVYYNAPTTGPVQQHINRGSNENSYYYTITTTKSETTSWAGGGGIKLKEKAGVFVGLQIEIEASVLYNSSTQIKDSESSTVVQNLLPDYGGAIYVGDPYLRTYGDYIVNLPNLTLIVTGQWIEAASGLGAQGPVANVVDYPLA
ncbi:hypothetical protein CRM90_06235 [Mycobacterium sp. ENV421]|nr:hypothetical protein CRM90_06235 [Mycobacterium sp. ENV421]